MDYRTKRQKLEAMANQNASPKEAAIARHKIKELDDAKDRQSFGIDNLIMPSGFFRFTNTVSFTMTGNFTDFSIFGTVRFTSHT